MRRRFGLVAPALAVALALGACSGGDGTQSLGPVPTAPTTTAPPATTTSSTAPPQVSTTRPPAIAAPATTAAPTTTIKPVLVGGNPQVTVTPARAAVNAVVSIEGTGFTDEMWKARGVSLWLAGTASGCNLYAEAQHSVTVSAGGRLTGTFTVPTTGNCRMSDLPPRGVPSGTFRIAYSCTACFIGELEVVVSPETCADVAFAPNSDNIATTIVASGVSCAEAEALVRKAGTQLRSVGGPSRAEVDGWVCVRTASSTGPGLPASDYECTSGSNKVTFHRL